MNIQIGDEITLSEDVVPENYSQDMGQRKSSCLCDPCHVHSDRALCRSASR